MNRVYLKNGTITLYMILLVALATFPTGCAQLQTGSAADIPRMSIVELAARLDDPAIHVIDVRLPYERRVKGSVIEGAILVDPFTFKRPPSKYPKSDTFVLYCS